MTQLQIWRSYLLACLLFEGIATGSAQGAVFRTRCLSQRQNARGIGSPRIALSCGLAFDEAKEHKTAVEYYELGIAKADPLLHAEFLPQLQYHAALAERLAGNLSGSADRFKELFEGLGPPESEKLEWWHEGLAAMRDAQRHDDAEELFAAAKKAMPLVKWANSWQIPRDIDVRALEGARPFHSHDDFEVPHILQLHASEILSEFRAFRASSQWQELFEVNEHETERNVAVGSWRHLYLKRLNGTWDETKCAFMPKACSLLRGRPEIDGRIFSTETVARSKEAKPLASTQGVAVLELAPNTHLRLHTGRNNFRLLAHLGLEVPENLCGISGGGEMRFWKEGSVLVIDDSFLHEAWNNSTDAARYVLYASFFPPSLAPELPKERAEL